MNTAELADLYDSLPTADDEARRFVAERAARVLRPAGAMARVDQIAVWLAGWQRTTRPTVQRPALVLAAADHGVAARGVSAYPQEVTKSMVAAIEAGVATSSVLARQAGAAIHLLDAGVGEPTGDSVTGPAMTEAQFDFRFCQGRDLVASLDCDLLAVGEMGIGNSTSSAAVAASVIGGDPASWVGSGTGVTGDALERKRQTVTAAVERVGRVEPLEALRQLGGGELAALAGAVVEARLLSIPVVLDGFIATAAVVPLHASAPEVLDHCIASHVSGEPGHRRMLDWMGKTALLDLDLRLGEGSGALLAIPIIKMAAAAVTDVATFEEWGLE